MKQSSLLKYFPAPRFLNPPRLGVSFSDLSVKVVKLGEGISKFPVETLFIPLQPGVVAAGVILKPEELSKQVRDNIPNSHPKYVSFTMPDELSYVFNTYIPISAVANAEENVAASIEENVPLTLEETAFDFLPIAKRLGPLGAEVQVLVAACVKKEIEKVISLLMEAGLQPLSCLPESQAIAESVVPKSFSDTACIIHARDNRIGIYLVKNRIVRFSTLRSVSVDGDYQKEFTDEYQKFLEYLSKYDTAPDRAIKAVYVCGEFEYAKLIVSNIPQSKILGSKPVLANVWTNAFAIDEHTPELPYEASLSFAGAVGAAIAEVD